MNKIIPFRDKTPKKTGSIIGMMILISIFVIALLISPLFIVQRIEVQGNQRYTKEEILESLQIKTKISIFHFLFSNQEKKLMNDPYIASVQIQRDFPKEIKIEIIERKTIGYVPYMGAYLYIDKDGRVLETANHFTEPLPLLQGFNFHAFGLGDLLIVDEPEVFNVILKISQTMFKYELLDEVIKIDVEHPEDIQLQMKNIQVLLGGIDEYDYKIRALLQILDHIPEGDRGYLDLRDTTKPFVFKYLT
ncbi:MAG: FtsQ-type POTRA domain-containing protein [Epulopiscium sp.]|nr:FtsQ-type POTRA domain-containing protein [Candidatus Epulonipiscium sp.]